MAVQSFVDYFHFDPFCFRRGGFKLYTVYSRNEYIAPPQLQYNKTRLTVRYCKPKGRWIPCTTKIQSGLSRQSVWLSLPSSLLSSRFISHSRRFQDVCRGLFKLAFEVGGVVDYLLQRQTQHMSTLSLFQCQCQCQCQCHSLPTPTCKLGCTL